MNTGMNAHTGQAIAGLDYLNQRFNDVIKTAKGSLVGAREYGSDIHLQLDRNLNDLAKMTLFHHVAAAIKNPINGLADFKLEELALIIHQDNVAEIVVTGQHLNNPVRLAVYVGGTQ